MVMPLLSPAAGKLIFQLPEGSILNSNDLIAQLELDSPDAVVAAEQFRGTFPELGPPQVSSHGVDHRFQQARTAAQMTLAGASRCTTILGIDHAMLHLAGYASTRSIKIIARSRQAMPPRGCWCITALGGCWPTDRVCQAVQATKTKKVQCYHAWQTCLRLHQAL